MKKPILCLDFDGVLHSYTSGWQGPELVSDPPVPGAVDFLHAASEKFDICIFSTRSSAANGRSAMIEWLWASGVCPAVMNELQFPEQKPPAFLTIDDRAIQFTGVWPSVESLLEFKPWNK